MFTRSGGVWTEQQKLTASDGTVFGFFGWSGALSADGSTALVGSLSNSAYVFTQGGGMWTEQQKLTASDGAADDRFGHSVALSPDGLAALLGAYADDDEGEDSGSAYVFALVGGSWVEQRKLTASDGNANAQFGYSVALSSYGSTALLGANHDNDLGVDSGSAYLFLDLTLCQLDRDEDGFGDVCDCNNGDPSVWSRPGEVPELGFGPGKSTVFWSAPSATGGVPGSALYDTILSPDSADFLSGGVCIETDDGSDLEASAPTDPPSGVVWFFLARAENDCGEGSTGSGSSGPRPVAASCPWFAGPQARSAVR